MSLMHIVPIFLYLSIGMHASIVIGIVGNPSVISFHVLSFLPGVDVSYVAPQALGIVNVALHREYSPGIVFIFSQGRNDLYHV
jgi:hypothetical protein